MKNYKMSKDLFANSWFSALPLVVIDEKYSETISKTKYRAWSPKFQTGINTECLTLKCPFLNGFEGQKD